MWGVLYLISEYCLHNLDIREGYPESYTRDYLEVVDNEENKYKAVVYYRTGKKQGKPSEEYVRTVVEGASSAGLPKDYIQKYILADP